MKTKLIKSLLIVALTTSSFVVQAQTTTYNVNPEIVSGQVYHNDGIISDISDVPTNNPYLNGNTIDGTTVLKVGKSASTGASFVTNAVIPFKLPARPSGKLVVAANLKVNLAYLRHWIDANVDLYGLPYNASATINSSDYYDGTYADPTGTVTAIQSGFIIRDTGGSEPLGTQILTDREVNSNASGDTALLAYINAQYDAGAVAGDYVFLRMSINVSSASVPNGLLGGHYYGISDGRTANAPELLLEIQDADPGAAATADFTITTPAEDGYVSDPGVIVANNPFLTGAAKLGKSAVDGSANLTTVILPFALPARPAGETVDFANLNVYVSFGRQFVNANVDLHGLTFKQSIANGGTGSAISSADHFGGAYPDATAGVTAIEDDYFTKNVPLNNLDTPRWEETTAEANLIAYLNAQYDAGAVAGDWVFLRLNMDNAAMTGSQYFSIDGGDSANPAALEIGFTNAATTNTWLGGTTDWATPGNWSEGTIPTAAENVVIPDLANDPIIGATTGAVANDITTNNVLTIASGGSLIVSGTATGNITYNTTIADGNWHLVSSPLAGETYGGATTWIVDNLIKTGGNTDNRGIATYQNGAADVTTGPWTYYSFSTGTETTFASGTGYNMIATGATTYSFTGTYPTLPNAPTITQGVASNNWNLVGNPAPAYIDVAAYITANTGSLSSGAFQALYVYSLANGYTGVTTGHIHPGQAFFVNSNVASGSISTTAAVLSHQTGVTFHKSDKTSIELTISEGNSSRKTSLEYSSNGTLGLDPGKDIGKFNGVNIPLNIFTHLLDNNEGIAFQKQALPNSEFESMIVPVGVKAASGKEITFSVTSLNLPDGIKVFLEDRELNIFTNLSEVNYKITLDKDINGTGRFFLKTTSSALSTENLELSGISIYKTSDSNLRISGLQKGEISVSLFNMLGKQIMKTSLEASITQKIALPKLATGIYIVKLQTENGKLNKKIILE